MLDQVEIIKAAERMRRKPYGLHDPDVKMVTDWVLNGGERAPLVPAVSEVREVIKEVVALAGPCLVCAARQEADRVRAKLAMQRLREKRRAAGEPAR